MDSSDILPTWAKRVRQKDIASLYAQDAQGIHEDELVDQVGWDLLGRCQSFITAVDAVGGRVSCPSCTETVLHHSEPEEVLHCPRCGWEITWQAYFKTIQHKQLSGASPVVNLFQVFVDHFLHAQTYAEKMVLIDQLIHGFHWNLQYGPTRAVGVNLIDGRYHEVVEFLDRLSYGNASTPGTQQAWQTWRETIDGTAYKWHDERLRREPASENQEKIRKDNDGQTN